MQTDSEFYWGSVSGARWEPIEVTFENNKRVGRTIGCPDPFFLDEVPCDLKLGAPMSRPFGPLTEAEMQERQKAVDKERRRRKRLGLPAHSWRGFR